MFDVKYCIMLRNENELFSDRCWVYVQQDDDNDGYTVGITYDEDFYQKETSAGRSLLLWRKFDDTLSAAGYRIVLKKLPKDAFKKVLEEHYLDNKSSDYEKNNLE